MEALYTLEEKVCKMLEDYAQEKRLSGSSMEAVHILTDTLKNIYKIEMIKEGGYSEDGYSNNGQWHAEGSYGNGSSYARRRDSMGRYSRDGDGGYSNRGYSRNSHGGYSGDKGRILQKLKGMLHDAGNEHERRTIEEAIEALEKG